MAETKTSSGVSKLVLTAPGIVISQKRMPTKYGETHEIIFKNVLAFNFYKKKNIKTYYPFTYY